MRASAEGAAIVTTDGRMRSTPQLVMGLLIAMVGVLFTLDTLDYLDAERVLRYWPAGVIAVGLSKLWQSRDGHGGAFGGVVVTVVGVWMLLGFSVRSVEVDFSAVWPLLMVLFGISLVWRSMTARRPAPTDTNSTVSAFAMLGGVNRGNNWATFRGGDLTAILGGCEIDLRQAKIDGEAIIDVFAMWGGIEIKVPDDWTVIGRVTPIMGGVEDKTRAPQTATGQRLIVRGFVLMGGVEVKN